MSNAFSGPSIVTYWGDIFTLSSRIYCGSTFMLFFSFTGTVLVFKILNGLEKESGCVSVGVNSEVILEIEDLIISK